MANRWSVRDPGWGDSDSGRRPSVSDTWTPSSGADAGEPQTDCLVIPSAYCHLVSRPASTLVVNGNSTSHTIMWHLSFIPYSLHSFNYFPPVKSL